MEKKEVLVFRKQRFRTNSPLYRIRVGGDAYEIVEDVANRTNMTMNEVASMMIRFAYKHTQVIDKEENNVR